MLTTFTTVNINMYMTTMYSSTVNTRKNPEVCDNTINSLLQVEQLNVKVTTITSIYTNITIITLLTLKYF